MSDAPLDPIAAAGDALRTRLGRSAQHQALSALDSYVADDAANFFVHAGIALEHAIKARLVRHNVFLVADAKQDWFEHGFALVFPDRNTKSRVLTVGAAIALDRLQKLDRALPTEFTSQVAAAIEMRNEVIHLGLAVKPSSEVLLSNRVLKFG